MAHEYVGISNSQKIYGKKQLLYCEMELLTVLKRYETYKKLRKEELALKKILKKQISEVQDEIKKFNDLLPKIPHEKSKPKPEISKENKKRKDLQDEINEIKRRIAQLQTFS